MANLGSREALVEQHIRCENQHDLDGVMATFGLAAQYDDEPWRDHRIGRAEVRRYYADLLRALPDMSIDVLRRHVGSDAIVLEVVIRGTHLDEWRQLPATGRKVEIPLCGVFTFDAENWLAGERIYYDRAIVLGQLGVFREPLTTVGRMTTALLHPITVTRAYLRSFSARHKT